MLQHWIHTRACVYAYTLRALHTFHKARRYNVSDVKGGPRYLSHP